MRSSVPSPYELVRDVRFWLALLLVASVVPALYTVLQAAGQRSGDVMV
jgi:hypothetical protein